MKRLKLLVLPLLLLPFFAKAPTVKVYAEGEEQVVEQVETEAKENEEVSKLGEILNVNTIANIVSWLVSSGVLTFGLAVLVKAKKYVCKDNDDIVETFEGKVSEYLQKAFEKLSTDKLAGLTTKLDDLENATETLMKVLVLAQDNTAKGKVALIEYLGKQTKCEEVKEAVCEVATELKEAEEKATIAKEKVQEEYKEIF